MTLVRNLVDINVLKQFSNMGIQPIYIYIGVYNRNGIQLVSIREKKVNKMTED